MRWILVSGSLLVVAASLVLFSGGTQSQAGLSSQDAYKLAKVLETAEELAARDTSHLTTAQRTKRFALIEELHAYAARRRFAQNDTYPGHAIPELVDRRGNKCALANLMQFTGDKPLLNRLAREHNSDFIRSLLGDPDFGTWVHDNGLTFDEATYIMGPGYVQPRPAKNDVPDAPVPTDDPTDDPQENPAEDLQDPAVDPTPDPQEDPEPTPGDDDPQEDPQDAGTPPMLPPRGGPTTPGTIRLPDTTRRKPGPTATDTWERWWSLNRNAFINLRQRYHKSPNVTPRESAFDGWRPSDVEVSAGLIPFFRSVAAGPNPNTRATALAAWARAARPKHAGDLGAALRAYLRDGNNAYRQLIIMKFGTVPHVTTQPALREILLDTKEGRKLLGTNGAITESMRAFAAIALGHTGKPEAVDDLMRVLSIRKRAMPDLRAACVLAVGVLGRTGDDVLRGRVIRFLVKHLRERRWPDQSLAMIPTALAATGDETVVVELQEILGRFRKPRVVRQSCALAIAALAPQLTEPLIDTLIGNARRDADDTVRRFALVALGQIADRHPVSSDPTRIKGDAVLSGKLAQFYAGCIKGLNLQKQDMPWVYLSMALYGRRFEERSNEAATHLLDAVADRASVDRRCASLVALGLLGNPNAIKPVRDVLLKAKDKRTRASAAETLGLLGDRTSREFLRALATSSPSDRVRYGAALGLGFLADRNSLDMLIETFRTTGSHAAQATLARVIGEIGDRRAIAPLMKLASDKKVDQWTRRRALAALGMIGQAEDEASVTLYQKAVNYVQATPSIQTVLGLF